MGLVISADAHRAVGRSVLSTTSSSCVINCNTTGFATRFRGSPGPVFFVRTGLTLLAGVDVRDILQTHDSTEHIVFVAIDHILQRHATLI